MLRRKNNLTLPERKFPMRALRFSGGHLLRSVFIFTWIFLSSTLGVAATDENEDRLSCVNNDADIQQAFMAYAYLRGWDYPGFLKDMEQEGFRYPQLKALGRSFRTEDLQSVDMIFSFIHEQHALQGNRVGQFVALNNDPAWRNVQWPDSAAFSVTSLPQYPEKVLVVLSDTSPRNVFVFTIDRCFNIEVLFEKFKFKNFKGYRYQRWPGLFESPLRRVEIGPKGKILLYENDVKKPYVLEDLLREYRELSAQQP